MSEGREPAEAARVQRIAVSASVARTLLDINDRLGVAYGNQNEQMIAEETFAGHTLQVTLRHDSSGWTLKVRSTPALRAEVALNLSGRSWRQSFSTEGEASFVTSDEAGLRQGFDLIVELAPSNDQVRPAADQGEL